MVQHQHTLQTFRTAQMTSQCNGSFFLNFVKTNVYKKMHPTVPLSVEFLGGNCKRNSFSPTDVPTRYSLAFLRERNSSYSGRYVISNPLPVLTRLSLSLFKEHASFKRDVRNQNRISHFPEYSFRPPLFLHSTPKTTTNSFTKLTLIT